MSFTKNPEISDELRLEWQQAVEGVHLLVNSVIHSPADVEALDKIIGFLESFGSWLYPKEQFKPQQKTYVQFASNDLYSYFKNHLNLDDPQ